MPAPRTTPVDSCPCCGSVGAQKFFTTTDRLHGTPGEFTYKRCLSCESVFQDPRVRDEDLASCYPTTYYTHVPRGELPPRAVASFRDIIRTAVMRSRDTQAAHDFRWYLGKLLGSVRAVREQAFFGLLDPMIDGNQMRSHEPALDVGCGGGYLLSALARTGWDAMGVEVDPQAATAARSLSGCPVQVGHFLQLELPENHFRLVTMHHVFEHVANPVSVIERIARILKPGGRAVLVFPNPQSLGAKAYGVNWFPWEVPRHLVFPTRTALALMASHASLELSASTLTRAASGYASQSRAYARGEPVLSAQRNTVTRLFEAAELTLCTFGAHLGEETVAVLTKSGG